MASLKSVIVVALGALMLSSSVRADVPACLADPSVRCCTDLKASEIITSSLECGCTLATIGFDNADTCCEILSGTTALNNLMESIDSVLGPRVPIVDDLLEEPTEEEEPTDSPGESPGEGEEEPSQGGSDGNGSNAGVHINIKNCGGGCGSKQNVEIKDVYVNGDQVEDIVVDTSNDTTQDGTSNDL